MFSGLTLVSTIVILGSFYTYLVDDIGLRLLLNNIGFALMIFSLAIRPTMFYTPILDVFKGSVPVLFVSSRYCNVIQFSGLAMLLFI